MEALSKLHPVAQVSIIVFIALVAVIYILAVTDNIHILRKRK